MTENFAAIKKCIHNHRPEKIRAAERGGWDYEEDRARAHRQLNALTEEHAWVLAFVKERAFLATGLAHGSPTKEERADNVGRAGALNEIAREIRARREREIVK